MKNPIEPISKGQTSLRTKPKGYYLGIKGKNNEFLNIVHSRRNCIISQ